MTGVVYMVLVMLLTTYFIATTHWLTGIPGLMLAPACAGLSVQCFNSRWKCRRGMQQGSSAVFLALGIAAAGAAAYTLITGIGQLMRQLSL